MISDILFGVSDILFPYRKMQNHMSHVHTSTIMMVNSRRHLIIVEFCDLTSVLSLYGASRHRKWIHVIKFFTFSLYQYFYTSLIHSKFNWNLQKKSTSKNRAPFRSSQMQTEQEMGSSAEKESDQLEQEMVKFDLILEFWALRFWWKGWVSGKCFENSSDRQVKHSASSLWLGYWCWTGCTNYGRCRKPTCASFSCCRCYYYKWNQLDTQQNRGFCRPLTPCCAASIWQLTFWKKTNFSDRFHFVEH